MSGVTMLRAQPADPFPTSPVVKSPDAIGMRVLYEAQGALAVARGPLSPGRCTRDGLKAARKRLLGHAKALRALALSIKTWERTFGSASITPEIKIRAMPLTGSCVAGSNPKMCHRCGRTMILSVGPRRDDKFKT